MSSLLSKFEKVIDGLESLDSSLSRSNHAHVDARNKFLQVADGLEKFVSMVVFERAVELLSSSFPSFVHLFYLRLLVIHKRLEQRKVQVWR